MRNNIFSVIISAIKAKIMPLWIKLRLWTSPAFFQSQILGKVRKFFSSLLDVKPRNRKDYYPMFRWLVSKRLAFAIVVVAGIASGFYIAMMIPGYASGTTASIPSYRYRSIPLKFHSGMVQILAKDGKVSYVGEVSKGSCVGRGTLYNATGQTVYEGQFANNMFQGAGTLYHPGGGIRYTGSFSENLFNGAGFSFRANGSKEYEGDYVFGARTGNGKLYNSTGRKIFEGTFLNDDIVYNDFLDKPTAEVASLYSGAVSVYSSDAEYCVAMPEIDAVYAVKDGSNTLENEWTVSSIYVLSDSFPLDGDTYTDFSQLQAALGPPLYSGTGWVDLPETTALNLLAQSAASPFGTVPIQTTPSFDNVFTVTGYDKNFQVYLYSYERSGLLYTFYCTGPSVSNFVMYSIESTGK